MRQLFFTADLHLFDDTIAMYRGFPNAQSYREIMAKHWNDTVSDDDLVFILGDISISFQPSAVEFIHKQLKGHKILIPGNHDSFNACQLFNNEANCTVRMPGDIIKIMDRSIILTHYPVHSDELKFFDFNIHGHIHHPIPEIGYEPNKWPNPLRNTGYNAGHSPFYFNANLEFHNWTPVSVDEVIEWFKINNYDRPNI